MSRWTHAICDFCWEDREGDRVPFRITPESGTLVVPCCFCGERGVNGIYTRTDPEKIKCKGVGPAHQDEED